MTENPTDGSIWMGTSGQGLYRLGRNGKQIHYSQKEGVLPSDSIQTLFFDSQHVLWILDNRGRFTTYTSTGGFSENTAWKEKTDCAVYDEKSNCIYFATGKSLRTYNNVSGKTIELTTLPSPAKSLKTTENGANYLWVFCGNGVLKVSADGKIQAWEDAPGVLDLLPYNFETNPQQSGVEGQNERSLWPIILRVILALLAGLAVGYFLPKKKKGQPEVKEPVKNIITPRPEITTPVTQPVITTTPAVQPENAETAAEKEKTVVEQPQAPVRTKATFKGTETVLKGPFSKEVYGIIKEHLSEPDFDVEAIASIKGMSRIHVNRKLRQEGAPAPSVLIKQARMHHAARLIRQGKLGMSQISSLCGFRTPSYFATAFKEFYGVTPSEFTEGQ